MNTITLSLLLVLNTKAKGYITITYDNGSSRVNPNSAPVSIELPDDGKFAITLHPTLYPTLNATYMEDNTIRFEVSPKWDLVGDEAHLPLADEQMIIVSVEPGSGGGEIGLAIVGTVELTNPNH